MTSPRAQRAETVVEALGLGLMGLGWVQLAALAAPLVRLLRGVAPAQGVLAAIALPAVAAGLGLWAGRALLRGGGRALGVVNLYIIGALAVVGLGFALTGGPLGLALSEASVGLGVPLGLMVLVAHPGLRTRARRADGPLPRHSILGAFALLHEVALVSALAGAALVASPLDDGVRLAVNLGVAMAYTARAWVGMNLGLAALGGQASDWSRWHRASVAALLVALVGGGVLLALRRAESTPLIEAITPWLLAAQVWPNLARWRGRVAATEPAPASGSVVVGLGLLGLGCVALVFGAGGQVPAYGLLGAGLALGGGWLVVGRSGWLAAIAWLAVVGLSAVVALTAWALFSRGAGVGLLGAALALGAAGWVALRPGRMLPRWGWLPLCVVVALPFTRGRRTSEAPGWTVPEPDRPAAPAASTASAADPRQALIARGAQLFSELACRNCHSLDGTRSVGPSILDIAGRTITLTDGRQVVADAAYLQRALTDPRADVPKGYPPSMPSYVGRLRGADLAAVVMFMQSIKTAR